MEKYLDMLSWWQMPLTSIGTLLLSSLTDVLSVFTLLGIAYYVFHRI